MIMNIHEEYQRENEFSEDEKIYYILTGEGGAAMISKKISCRSIMRCLTTGMRNISIPSMTAG